MVNGIDSSGYDVTSIWQSLFNKIDQDGDGSIDKTEMESVLSKSGPSVEDIFSKLDTDQDGVIGKNEFEEALSKLREHHPPGPPPQANMGAGPEDMFNKIDQNADGSITKDELTSFMGQSAASSDVDKIFKEVDTDNDGVISRSESDAHMEKMKEEGKGGPPPDFVASNANDDQDWEIKMIEKLLRGYDVASNGSTESVLRYT
jgi:Ca2+-binding EF-hand superfamily protein